MRSVIGQGETEANNRGPFIHWPLDGHKLGRPAPAWCALACLRAYVLAYGSMFQPVLPGWLFRDRACRIPEPGALRLVAGMGMAGRKFKAIGWVRPGDLALWRRTDGHH